MDSGDQLRPLVLWGLVSSRIYDSHQGGDFYLGLTPFFEPFIQDNTGKLLDVEQFRTYAKVALRLPLSDDVTELLISRMEGIGWLKLEAHDSAHRIYRCQAARREHAIDNVYLDLEKQFDDILREFRRYLSDNSATISDASNLRLEEDFLTFLNKAAFAPSSPKQAAPQSAATGSDVDKIEYWVAKFIAWLNLRDPAKFRLIQQIAGVALLAEALMEVRSPTSALKQRTEIAVILDGPFLMEYMGLSGVRLRENATFVIDKLKGVGASIACFRHSCDEIRDNLFALLERAPLDRQGPTAEALRNDEVSDTLVINVKNNVEHFVKTLVGVTVLNQRVDQLKTTARFCDDRVQYRLQMNMPSQKEVGRARDADSITIVMRRRQGYETTNLLSAKALFLTSNEELVRRSNETLRAAHVLSQDRSIIGPVLHHRVVSGLLFANLGGTDKSEVSRRQLLAACAKVVMLRPRLVERVRNQIIALNKPGELAIVDALLSQPRATEVLMDFAVGRGQSISASNVDDVVRLVKKTAADEVKQEYEEKILAERKATADVMEIQRITSDAAVESERVKRAQETAALNARLSDLEVHINHLSIAKAASDATLRGERQRSDERAIKIAKDMLHRTQQVERVARIAVTTVLIPCFLVPVIFVNNPWAPWLGSVAAVVSILALNGFLWNRPALLFSHAVHRYAERTVRAELDRVGMTDYSSRIKVNYAENLAEIVEA